MPNLIKVEGHDNLGRDPVTGAIINRNKDGYNAYMESVRKHREKDEEINRQKQELNNVKQELAEIKDLLRQLIIKE